MCFVVIASGKGVFHKNILSEKYLACKVPEHKFPDTENVPHLLGGGKCYFISAMKLLLI